ncbi:MAG: hypothetical protein GIW99_09840, partial [Candidatus Eremiobacteraeota bacterium]|nr:hypothetical protein [Candidatus Eremiobacteraeota bacterium]
MIDATHWPGEFRMLAPDRSAEAAEAEQLIVETVQQLVRERVAPRAADIDATGEYPKDLR